jgi:hypothetical protein
MFRIGRGILRTDRSRARRNWRDYNVLEGRIWVLVLITTAVSPLATAWIRDLI